MSSDNPTLNPATAQVLAKLPPISASPNWFGFRTLLIKEIMRFWKVAFQTIAAPVLTALLYLLIFSSVLADHVQVYPGVSYVQFLIPGLAMMSALQNAFANSSSSIIQSKTMGSILFVLLTPLSHRDLFFAYLIAAIVRGFMVGLGVFLVALFLVRVPIANPLWIIAFTFVGCGILGGLGIIAGVWAEKFDQIAAFSNFFVVPLTFLAGVFYSTQALPPFWRAVSHANPFFYLIDGFRYGFFGVADVSPWVSMGVASITFAIVSFITLRLLKSGYRLRH